MAHGIAIEHSGGAGGDVKLLLELLKVRSGGRPLDARASSSTLLRGTFWALAVNATGLGLGFLTQKILANSLGPAGFGLYLYVLGWANVAGLLCALEFANAAVRYVSAYTATEDWAGLRGFLRRSNQIVGGTTGVVAVFGCIVLLAMPRLQRETRICFLAACALFPLSSLLQLHGAVLLGWKRVRASQLPFQVVRPAIFAIGLLLVARARASEFSAADAVEIQLFATAIAVFVTAWYMMRATPKEALTVKPVYHTREWVTTSSHFVAISIAQLVLSAQSDLLFVGTLLGKAEVGLYGAASQIAMLVGFGSTAIMVIAQPMIADLYARREIAQLKRLSRDIVKLALFASAPVFVGVLAFAKMLLVRIYGPDFASALPVLIVLATAQLVAAVVGNLLGYLFTMTAHQQMATKIIGSTAVLNIVLALILTYSFGMVGTATATAISTIARSVALFVGARRIVFVETTAVGLEAPAT